MSREAPSLFADRDLPKTAPVISNEGPIEIAAVLKEERPLAVRIYHRGRMHWLQRAKITLVRDGANGAITIGMSRAYAAEKGIA